MGYWKAAFDQQFSSDFSGSVKIGIDPRSKMFRNRSSPGFLVCPLQNMWDCFKGTIYPIGGTKKPWILFKGTIYPIGGT